MNNVNYTVGFCIHIYEMNNVLYTQKFLRYEICAEQEANRIFAIIFLRTTGSSWKGSMLCTVTNF